MRFILTFNIIRRAVYKYNIYAHINDFYIKISSTYISILSTKIENTRFYYFLYRSVRYFNLSIVKYIKCIFSNITTVVRNTTFDRIYKNSSQTLKIESEDTKKCKFLILFNDIIQKKLYLTTINILSI